MKTIDSQDAAPENPNYMHRGDHKRRRVFILGAGVSASCGIPVAQSILRESLCRLAMTDASEVKKVHNLLAYLYPGFDADLRNYPNIEDFLNLIEMAKAFNSEEFIESSLWPEPRLEEVRNITLRSVTDFLWSKASDNTTSAALDYFAKHFLKISDTVITFNWDITLEGALESRPDDFWIVNSYTKKRTKSKRIAILKPHGSIDWYKKSELPKSAVSKTIVLDEEYAIYPFSNHSRNPQLRSLQPLIVPPLTNKNFSVEILKTTWISVYRAISSATDLYVIGYSLPKEDQFARFVFRRAIRSNMLKHRRREKPPLRMTVVNPDDSVAVTFTRMAASQFGIRYFQARFEDFTSWLQAE